MFICYDRRRKLFLKLGQGGIIMFLKKADQMEIPIECISANQNQPRKIFEDRELNELSESIKEYGIIQPLIVRKSGKDSYVLIAGERRLRAAILAGLKKVPTIVRDASDKDTALLALVENVQRENLNYIEEAEAYKKLMDDYGLTQTDIAKKMGKQQSTISNKIRLLALPEDIRMVLAENHLSERHARALLRLPDEAMRKQILQRITDNGLNVKQTEKLIDDVLTKHEEERRRGDKLRYINYKIYINTLKKAFTSINEAEKDAKYFQEDKGDHYEVKIIIPKSSNKNNVTLVK